MENIRRPDAMEADKDPAEALRFFKQKFKKIMLASKQHDPSDIKCALLLNHIGDKGLKISNTFKMKKEYDMDYSEVFEKFEEYFKPTKNVTYERHIFLREMKSNETIDEYMTRHF